MLGPKMAAFLAAYEETGCVVRAAKAAGIQRGLHYRALRGSEAYRAAFAVAEENFGDMLEGHARHMARVGWLEPVFQNGVLIGYKTKHSTALIIHMLEGVKPEKYRKNVKVEHTGDLNVIVEKLAAARKRLQAERSPVPVPDDSDGKSD